MIKNTKQAIATRLRLLEMEQQLAKILANNSSLPYEKVVVNSISGFINDLKSELLEFDSLIKNDECKIKGGDLSQLPRMLIEARLSRGLSQKDLAEKLGIDHQQIQRYEISDYESASWSRLLEVAIALELQISLEDHWINDIDTLCQSK